MKEKLYCYVDETGQDTKGRLFIVVAIIIDKEKEGLTKKLEKIEQDSGKKKTKWMKVKTKQKIIDKYLNLALSRKNFGNRIFYQVFKESKMYQDCTSLVVAKSINRYTEKHKIKSYQTIVIIDGLRKTEVHKISKALHDLGIITRKVRGVRDESDAIIRIADSVVGVIREAEEGNQKFQKIKKEIVGNNIINRLD